MVSEKLLHKFEERSNCVQSVQTAGTRLAGLESAEKNLREVGTSEYETWVLTNYP
jgi:hypothetical protein